MPTSSGQELRQFPDGTYVQRASEKVVVVGMRRPEVIEALGYFVDQNTLTLDEGVRYEQLLFENGRQVFLRNGLLCSWSE